MVLLSGCGGSRLTPASSPPFQMSESVGEGATADPAIEVLEPKDSHIIRAKADDPIVCRVRLTYPGGGYLPTFFMAEFRDAKGNNAGNTSLDPIEKSGKSYVLGSILKAPSRPGVYQLVFDATFVDRTPTADGKPAWPPKESHTVLKVNTVEVRTK
jgi:hypothetical protein